MAEKPGTELIEHDISGERWREYQFREVSGDRLTVYRILDPVKLFLKKYPDGTPGTTHRVLDARGVMHCVPAIGQLGCVLRWEPKDPAKPVWF